MVSHAKRITRLALGGVLVIVGIAGLILPILPGWVFIIPGMLLLGFDGAWMLRTIERGERKFPRYRDWFERLRRWVPGGGTSHDRASDSEQQTAA